jgi:integrase
MGHSATWHCSKLALHGPQGSISGRKTLSSLKLAQTSPPNRKGGAQMDMHFQSEPDIRVTQSCENPAPMEWLSMIGLDPCSYGTHSLRRTKATLIYKKTENLRAVQLLLGHTKIESTVRYLGIEVDDALAVAEQIDV